jgi:hypothetical protein
VEITKVEVKAEVCERSALPVHTRTSAPGPRSALPVHTRKSAGMPTRRSIGSIHPWPDSNDLGVIAFDGQWIR